MGTGAHAPKGLELGDDDSSFPRSVPVRLPFQRGRVVRARRGPRPSRRRDGRVGRHAHRAGSGAMSIPDPPDAVVVASVLGGATDHFSILVVRYEDALFRHARSLGLDPDTASDMVQDAMVRAWERLGECRDPVHFRIWVGRILRNRCLDHLKRASSRRNSSLEGREGGQGHDLSAAFAEGADDVLHRQALSAAIDDALAGLPGDQAEAFVLKHVEGLSYEEMGALTGASVSALKMRVHRARDVMRAHLEAAGIGSM
ncbi:MAG: RNA polymerase sigma factor [Gemmatimonadales bacterium]|nr:MAG: RNA polymerase sigma factor [Gemmatimonadales bacterium]